MFVPEFNYTHSIVRNLMHIEGAKEVIENSVVLPIWQSRRQKEALIRQAHHTTHIEGAQLTIEQVRDLIDDKTIVARKRDIQEVRNYLKVAAFIDEVYGDPDDANPGGYYEALQSVRTTDELTTWLEYFTAGIAEEMQKIKEQVLAHSRDGALRDKIGQVKLSPRQLEILSYVEKKWADY